MTARRSLEKLLVANRGEIALRIMRTARRMGLSTVAVYSKADRHAPHVRFADEAVCIGPAPSQDSYLKVEAILSAAALTRADCVHPGYGFLSENAGFAQAVTDAGLVFVGPTASAIRAMGLKREAKALVAKLGVPLVPGFDGGDQSMEVLKGKAVELGFPVIFKPSAGGGGKGMRIVRAEHELEAAIESGRREAQSAFSDPTLIIEKYLERPRHLEIQLLGDEHGNVVHLFERECSIQRRHQKVIEETPSLALDPAARAAMGEAAVRIARAIGYTSAGTVEFIMSAEGQFYFSEMNTRLQVEHRVTELVVGVDLVELQLRIARGEALPFTQQQLAQTGHAVQCRLYAEDPANDFLPSTGTLFDWHTPELGGLLVDSGVERGGEISMHYDPMIAKVVTWGEDRTASTGKMARALEGLSAQGVTTNRAFLTRLLRHPEYVAGRLHTGFIAEHAAALAEVPDAEAERLAAIAATLAGALRRRAEDPLPSIPAGFRNSRFADQFVEYGALRVEYRALGEERFLVRIAGKESTCRVLRFEEPTLTFELEDGRLVRARVTEGQGKLWVHTPLGSITLTETPRFPPPADEANRGGLIAPMPGKVVKVLVKDGEAVTRGQVVLVLEAMKMEQSTRSPEDGIVAQVHVREGDQVTAGQVLLSLREAGA